MIPLDLVTTNATAATDYILLEQGLGIIGLVLLMTGSLFAIYATRKEDPIVGFVIGLIVLFIGGVFTYVFMLGGD